MRTNMPRAELIVAVDTHDVQSAYALATALQGHVNWLKVGLELFVAGGPQVVQKIKDLGFKVFLDLKMYDIPNTVHGGVLSAASLGADMLTIHVQGGERMAKAAMEASHSLPSEKRPLIFGVTVLTSMANGDLPTYSGDVSTLAFELAKSAHSWGLDGIVSSGHEVEGIKATCGGDFLCLTPGIRPAGHGTDDQRRLMTPEQAVKAGSNFLVVGRPITKAEKPSQIAQDIVAQIS